LQLTLVIIKGGILALGIEGNFNTPKALLHRFQCFFCFWHLGDTKSRGANHMKDLFLEKMDPSHHIIKKKMSELLYLDKTLQHVANI
jgi:hypothetical protein